MSTHQKLVLSIAALIALFACALLLARRGVYGWTLFVMLPVIAGALGVWNLQPRTMLRSVQFGALLGLIGCALFLVLGEEGIICVLMAVPVVVPLSIAGSLLAYWARALSHRKSGATMCLLLPLSFFSDVHSRPPVYTVSTPIVVNASPERVWKNVVAFPGIPDQADWLLRTGLAYPIRTRLVGSGTGASRSCDLSTGTVQERVVNWEEPRLLRFVATATPPPMKGWGCMDQYRRSTSTGISSQSKVNFN